MSPTNYSWTFSPAVMGMFDIPKQEADEFEHWPEPSQYSYQAYSQQHHEQESTSSVPRASEMSIRKPYTKTTEPFRPKRMESKPISKDFRPSRSSRNSLNSRPRLSSPVRKATVQPAGNSPDPSFEKSDFHEYVEEDFGAGIVERFPLIVQLLEQPSTLMSKGEAEKKLNKECGDRYNNGGYLAELEIQNQMTELFNIPPTLPYLNPTFLLESCLRYRNPQ